MVTSKIQCLTKKAAFEFDIVVIIQIQSKKTNPLFQVLKCFLCEQSVPSIPQQVLALCDAVSLIISKAPEISTLEGLPWSLWHGGLFFCLYWNTALRVYISKYACLTNKWRQSRVLDSVKGAVLFSVGVVQRLLRAHKKMRCATSSSLEKMAETSNTHTHGNIWLPKTEEYKWR